MEQLAFYVLSILAVISSALMITRKNPVHSALWMLLTFFAVAGIFVQLNAEYIAAIQILVYAGAILVLYLFVVMLLNPKTSGTMKFNARYVIGLVASVFIGVQVFVGINKGTALLGKSGNVSEVVAQHGYVAAFGKELFTTYLVPFEIASILLLVAMIGAIIIAKKERGE